jgi:hypothetical protein
MNVLSDWITVIIILDVSTLLAVLYACVPMALLENTPIAVVSILRGMSYLLRGMAISVFEEGYYKFNPNDLV